VRELQHCIERLTAMNSDGALQMADLPSALQYLHSAASLDQLSGMLDAPHTYGTPFELTAPTPVVSLPDSERSTIGHALSACRGEKGKAARMLKIGRTTLYRKMKQYGME
jgi:two-component system response regulator HydG